jgi:hypothetical protein
MPTGRRRFNSVHRWRWINVVLVAVVAVVAVVALAGCAQAP